MSSMRASAKYPVSQGCGAVLDVVLPLMDVQEDVQNKRGSESDTTEDANVHDDTAVEVPMPERDSRGGRVVSVLFLTWTGLLRPCTTTGCTA